MSPTSTMAVIAVSQTSSPSKRRFGTISQTHASDHAVRPVEMPKRIGFLQERGPSQGEGATSQTTPCAHPDSSNRHAAAYNGLTFNGLTRFRSMSCFRPLKTPGESTTTLAAVFHMIPVAFPFLAPREFPSASRASFSRKFRLFHNISEPVLNAQNRLRFHSNSMGPSPAEIVATFSNLSAGVSQRTVRTEPSARRMWTKPK